ncbi:Ankyrin repeat domain-containing protein [Sulfidibacter corallicola]|uniref:Ankyrin repeat domain-containing protein n=1 Tax=Sulfidibacter corallicola TaxID=2818388 RepID=A0A8A4TFX8_SULCO|nr:ankyrin repeat domain-containing protein [Sulfidibacter corallicola]QTD48460.1 ankyrin repeat domain-containing protein [Sulfidibacter corallicola]
MVTTPTDDIVTEYLRHACLNYHESDGPEKWRHATALLDRHAGLAEADLYTAAATGHLAAVRRRLAEHPELLDAKGGPFSWEPLLYATYGRVAWDGVVQDRKGVVAFLLDQGANPNVHWLWGDTYVFTAVTGALGNGERGPDRLPPLPDGFDIARLLLRHGADPNDGQALYNWMQSPGEACIELMLEFGLNPSHRVNWTRENPMRTLDYLLCHAAKVGLVARVEFLLRHGADPNADSGEGWTLYRAALRHGEYDIAEILANAGAATEATPTDRFLGACLNEDVEGIEALLATHPGLVAELSDGDREIFHQVAGRNLRRSAALLVRLGFDVNGREVSGYRHTPLHKAAMAGHRDMVDWLLARGADPAVRDATYRDVPSGWARYHGHEALAAHIEEQGNGRAPGTAKES